MNTGWLVRKVMIAVLAFAIIAVVAAAAGAEWIAIAGHSGHIQDKTVTNYYAGESFEYGWGLDIVQKPGTSNWVHFAVPGPAFSTKGVRYINLYFLTGSADAWVSDVDVYNGYTKVKSFTGTWADGWQNVTLDLGWIRPFSKGLGISVKINAGVESMNHRFVFATAKANFVDRP